MKRSWKNIFFGLKRFSFYIPFTLYFVLFGAAAYFGYRWLLAKSKIPDSSYKDIFTLLLSVALWAAITLICFCFITAALSFLAFLISKRKGNVLFEMNILEKSDAKEGNVQTVSIKLTPVLKPLLGFLKIRLNYDQVHFSDKFYLLQPASNSLFNLNLEGIYHWQLPEIREYRLEKAIVYFEDFFHFFSFAIPVHSTSGFHTYPGLINFENLKAFPRKTEETSVRIEELKKVEGELINYKNFESNDDVRRIVWKIYAKNKELVVRIPEILDPYASHVCFYASFHSVFNETNEVIRIPFLNYYKTICWSVYKQIEKKGLEIRFIPDQSIPAKVFSNEEDRVKFSISVSLWQNALDLKNYVKPGDASIVLISSLSDKEQVKELIDHYGNDISFVFVPLSECLSQNFIGHWIKWIFVQEEKDILSVYRTNWSLSLIRKKIEQNESDLTELLKDFEKSTVLSQRKFV